MLQFVINTAARIDAVFRNGGLEVEIDAPIRGEGLRRSRFSEQTHPEIIALLRRLWDTAQAGLSSITLGDALRLAELGLLVPDVNLPQPVDFDLGPPLQAVTGGFGPPAEIRIEAPGKGLPNVPLRMPEGGGIVWIRDRLRQIWVPYALPLDRYEMALRTNEGTLEGPFASGFPDPSGDVAGCRAEWRRKLASARERLELVGYATVPALLPAHLLAATGDYYRRRVSEGLMRFGDDQAPRFFEHREPVAEWLHEVVLEILRPMLADRYKSSYSFVCAYTGSGAVDRHTDRPQCEVTVSICVDASSGGEWWPLYLESAAEMAVVDVRLGIGNALVFRGRELPHFRKPLPQGERFTSLLFHFVSMGFDGVLD